MSTIYLTLYCKNLLKPFNMCSSSFSSLEFPHLVASTLFLKQSTITLVIQSSGTLLSAKIWLNRFVIHAVFTSSEVNSISNTTPQVFILFKTCLTSSMLI